MAAGAPVDDKVVVPLGSDHQPGEGTGVGVPGHQLLRFKAVGQGTDDHPAGVRATVGDRRRAGPDEEFDVTVS